jgi:DNA-binding beta-propeller fold protein YncE
MSGMVDNVRRNKMDAKIALVAAVLIIFVVIIRNQSGSSTGNSSPSNPVVPTVALPALAFAPVAGAPITITQVLGSGIGLSAPHDAIAVPGGNYATDNPDSGQIVLLNAKGKLIQTITQGSVPLRQPYGLAPAPDGFYVLEAESGTIDLFAPSGRFLHQVLQAPGLRIGRSLFAAPNGTLYVANPAANAVVVIGPNGTIVRQITSALSAAVGSFNQVSDAVADASGDIYLLDNQNNRIEALSPTGGFIAQWAVPPSDTLHSIHLRPRAGGGVLAVDPSGALLVYGPNGGAPLRQPLVLDGSPLPAGSTQLIGLASTPGGNLLVTDGRSSRVFVLPPP